MRAGFHEDLEALEQRIVRDLKLAAETLHALAVVVADPALPTPAYIEGDGERLRDGVRISRERLVVLTARQAPVAIDLRLVLALFQVTRYQWLIANQFRLLTEQLMEIDPDEASDAGIGERLGRMARTDSVMLGRAGAALAARDVADARALAVDDDVVDALNREVFTRALAVSAPVGRREVAMHQMLLARSLERVADNAVDIGKQVEFIVTGELA
jgi:phosphate transport system protein